VGELLAEGFGYRYPGAPAPALDGVSLRVEPGSFVVVAGESGSGKSTLLRAACGLVPHFHGGEAWGTLRVGGLDLREHGPAELSAVCGTVFQDPEAQVVMGGVRAEIALALEHRGDPAAAVARGVEEAALALGIGHLLERRTDTLSGGELQRVALAAALAPRPALLVLDEPTSQLDPVAGDELVSLLRRLNEEWGTTVLLAEHRIERCLAAADRVLALDRGRIACDAPPAEFLDWAAAEAPGLATPAARLFSLAGLRPLPPSVKQARRALARLPGGRSGGWRGDAPAAEPSQAEAAGAYRRQDPPAARFALRRPRRAHALVFRAVWHELDDGPAILRGIDLAVAPGELVALMGRNGAGKSTLLGHARGLLEPTRGRVERAGDVALLLQNPNDYLVHERAADEAGPAALARAGLAGGGERHPRDLSGGERQRLALEVALGEREWAAVCLDEPTRGMDRSRKHALSERLERIAAGGAAVVVATHDTEFAADLARRVVLMGEGVVIADGPPADVLAGGWHFATEVARVLDGAALTPERGARLIRAALGADPQEVVS
jgi:energy-coupling factor transport system ATP-binding protein